jgi:hypothetical protein
MANEQENSMSDTLFVRCIAREEVTLENDKRVDAGLVALTAEELKARFIERCAVLEKMTPDELLMQAEKVEREFQFYMRKVQADKDHQK